MIIGIHFLAALILLAYLATRILGIRAKDWANADCKNKLGMVAVVLFFAVVLPFYTINFICRELWRHYKQR